MRLRPGGRKLVRDEPGQVPCLPLRKRNDAPCLGPDPHTESNMVAWHHNRALRRLHDLITEIAADPKVSTFGIAVIDLHAGEEARELWRSRLQELGWEWVTTSQTVEVRHRLPLTTLRTKDGVQNHHPPESRS